MKTAGALTGRIGDPVQRGFDERAARRAAGGEIGGKLGKRREGGEFNGHDVGRNPVERSAGA
ncbi:hypothetical protein OKW44_007000 [Paraburkholderia sp. WSM4174]